MSGDRDIEETFLAACQALEEAEVRYAVIGGFAVSTWGAPRSTQDIDLLLGLDGEETARLVDALASADISLDARDLEDALEEGGHATAFDDRSIYHVDLRPASSDIDQQTIQEARTVEVEGRTIAIAGPEETIAHKLLYASEQDLADAETIYARQAGDLDRDRLDSLCSDLGVREELQQLRERVDEVGGGA